MYYYNNSNNIEKKKYNLKTHMPHIFFYIYINKGEYIK